MYMPTSTVQIMSIQLIAEITLSVQYRFVHSATWTEMNTGEEENRIYHVHIIYLYQIGYCA